MCFKTEEGKSECFIVALLIHAFFLGTLSVALRMEHG